jgi:hypothetical protein
MPREECPLQVASIFDIAGRRQAFGLPTYAAANLWAKAYEEHFHVEAAVSYDMPSTEEDVKHSLEAAAGG